MKRGISKNFSSPYYKLKREREKGREREKIIIIIIIIIIIFLISGRWNLLNLWNDDSSPDFKKCRRQRC